MCMNGGFKPMQLISPVDPIGSEVMKKMPEPVQKIADTPAQLMRKTVAQGDDGTSKGLVTAANPTSGREYKTVLGQ